MASRGEEPPRPTEDPRVVRTRNDLLRAAHRVLVEQGWEAVTHPHVAQAAGYARATVYNHWATRIDILKDVFIRLGDVDHPVPTGDVRSDLIQELIAFRSAMEHGGLDRALAALVGVTASSPEMIEVRDRVVTEGESIVRRLLASRLQGTELEAAALMLSGAVLHAALMHGRLPGDDLIAAAVDLTLRGAGAPAPAAR